MRTTRTALVMRVLLIGALGCDGSDDTNKSGSEDSVAGADGDAAGDTGAGDDSGDSFDSVAALETLLVGHYDSADQAAVDSGYYNILLTMCPVPYPELGDTVLYVEQTSADTPDSPYRQRLYVLEPGANAQQAVSRIFEMSGPGQLTGTCDQPDEFTLPIDRVTELEGCEVILDFTDETFVGGTIDDNCATDWNGATYATSEITLSESMLLSWDRGWSADGSYVWGATDGGYEFIRRTAVGEW